MRNVLALVSFRIYPTYMGGQKGVALFYKYLSSYYNVIMAVSRDNSTEDKEVLKCLYPNKKLYLNALVINKLKRVVKNCHIEIIIAEHSYTGGIAWALNQLTGVPFIIHSHNIESRRFLQMHRWWWKLYQYYEKWVHQKAAYNFFISQEDKDFAIRSFHLDSAKCSVITYGVEPTSGHNRALIRNKLNLPDNMAVLFFNGTLDYQPNLDALGVLLHKIDPLLKTRNFQYKIIITGNRASEETVHMLKTADNFIYLGYVEDISAYYQAADLFVNPVNNDSGVKTKVIESIANNCTVISTTSGASGTNKELCGQKLIIIPDNDWERFADSIIENHRFQKENTPTEFYDYYNWNNIAFKAKNILERIACT
jgi:glycosyltransferase involved in cell wall biosynthesis